MKEKFLKSEAILQSILEDKENVKRSDLTIVKEVLDLFELCIRQEVFVSVAAQSKDKNRVLSDIEGLIGTYEREIDMIKHKPISYQVNEGNRVVEMLQKYIGELSTVRDNINNGDYFDMVEPFNIEIVRANIVERIIDTLVRSGIANYFIEFDVLEKDGYRIDYDKIDRLFELISSEELLSSLGDIMPALKKQVNASFKLAGEEARLHKATALKKHQDDVIYYLARTNLEVKQDKHVQELVEDLGNARRELNQLLQETRLFQTVCKKEIDEQRRKVDSIRFRKIVARNILSSIQTTLNKMEMDFRSLNIDGLVQKLVDDRKVSFTISVPEFIREYSKTSFSWVEEIEYAGVIRRDVDRVYKNATTGFETAETKYKEARKDAEAAYDTLSKDAKEFIQGDIDGLVSTYDFMKSVVDGHYDVLIALFSLKLLNDASMLIYDDLVEVFGDPEDIKGLKEYYEAVMGHYAYGKNQEICDIQDSYMLECQSYPTYSKHL